MTATHSDEVAGKVVVVGAGVSGLTIAHQLLLEGFAVTIIEREGSVGGLARTFRYGGFCFDLGPHRFHTDNERVEQYIRSVLGSDAIEIGRCSGAKMFGRIHQWPLRPRILFSMPLAVMLRGARDLMSSRAEPGESFESDIVNRYGSTLYELFFKPYTEKFLFNDPARIHRDWARAGVNRAVIDKRASADSLMALLKTTMLPRPVDTNFIYAPQGVGQFADRLADTIRTLGGRLVLNAPVSGLDCDADAVSAVYADGHRFPCSRLVWTAPITTLNRHLNIGPFDLEFLATIFYNIETAVPVMPNYQWTYFGGDEIFSRVTAPASFTSTTVPGGAGALCVELTCREGDDRWSRPERYQESVVADLVRTGLLQTAADIRRVHIEKVKETYPIYKLNYKNELRRDFAALSHYRNVVTAGRSGRFWYNNMDHSIGQGLTVAARIAGGEALNRIDPGSREFW